MDFERNIIGGPRDVMVFLVTCDTPFKEASPDSDAADNAGGLLTPVDSKYRWTFNTGGLQILVDFQHRRTLNTEGSPIQADTQHTDASHKLTNGYIQDILVDNIIV